LPLANKTTLGCPKLTYHSEKTPLTIIPEGQSNTQNFTGGYIFGFNGMEQDNEVSGSGNSYDYGFRIYNPRLGRFLSVDPLAKSFPWNSPYSFAEGSPIENIDLDGAEKYNYRMSMTDQGEVKMELVSKQDIVEQVVVGYNAVAVGFSAVQVPIYETRINQRQEYNINGRNASLAAVQELQGTKTPVPIIKAGMDKIKADYAINKGQFSENYNVAFGRFLFEQGFKGITKSDYVKSALETWETVDNATWKNGSTLYHLYESFARQNDNTGYDKLLHFTASAYYTMSLGPNTSYTLGLSKEFFKDFVPGVFGIGEGWDSNDMNANQAGIDYGKTVNDAVENNLDEIQFLD
jgi:RHS repeat-associated protein